MGATPDGMERDVLRSGGLGNPRENPRAETQIGAVGETHDWLISREIVASVEIPVILAGGLGADNVAGAIRAVRPAGVDSKTKTDKEAGTGKDLDKVKQFVEAARSVV